MIKLLVLIGASFFQPQAQKDSIGVETINGKVFVIHKVGEKETLYALSKRYGTTVDAIVQQNPTAAAGLEIGQILKVPYTAPVKPRQQFSPFQKRITLLSMRSNSGITLRRIRCRWARSL
jgi:LysM repeat protein